MNLCLKLPQTWIETLHIGAYTEVKKEMQNQLKIIFSSSDIGALDPGLYLMSVSTTQKEFKLNIALKYTIIEDVLSVIIFKCTFKVRN